jgi:hypothetical protein
MVEVSLNQTMVFDAVLDAIRKLIAGTAELRRSGPAASCP